MGLLCGLGAAGIGIFLLVAAKPWDVDLKPGKALRIHDFVVIYEWWAAAINFALLILLALSARWWLKPARRPAVEWLPEQRTPRLVLAIGHCGDGADRLLGSSAHFAKPLGR